MVLAESFSIPVVAGGKDLRVINVERVLIIDDDESTLTILTEVLEAEGFEVIVARNGEEGLIQFDLNPADLVITDIVMPGKNGLDTILELRKKDPVLPILAISAGGCIPKERYLEMAEYLNNTKTLAKPFTRKELLNIVKKQLIVNDPPDGIIL